MKGPNVFAQILLVILMGVYFIRTTWPVFGVFSPLTPVAGIVLGTCLFAFHKPPTARGAWFYALVLMCVVGAIANLSLLHSTSPTYRNPTNRAFSWTSMICFVLLGATLLWQKFGTAQQLNGASHFRQVHSVERGPDHPIRSTTDTFDSRP